MFQVGRKVPVYLDCDSAIPLSCRPVFWLRVLSWRQQIEYAEAFDNLYSKAADLSFRDLSASMCDVLNKAYCGWNNCCNHATGEVADFDPQAWLDVLQDVGQAQELIRKALQGGRLTTDEKKSYELPPGSGQENSASNAEVASV